jgi:hypothetical protein
MRFVLIIKNNINDQMWICSMFVFAFGNSVFGSNCITMSLFHYSSVVYMKLRLQLYRNLRSVLAEHKLLNSGIDAIKTIIYVYIPYRNNIGLLFINDKFHSDVSFINGDNFTISKYLPFDMWKAQHCPPQYQFE